MGFIASKENFKTPSIELVLSLGFTFEKLLIRKILIRSN